MLCSQRVVLTLFVAAAMSVFSVAHAQCVGCGTAAPVIAGPAISGPVIAGPSYSSPCASGNCGGGYTGSYSGGFSGGAVVGDSFGYAGGGCPGGNCGGGHLGGGCAGGSCAAKHRAGRQDIAYQIDQIREQGEKIRQRNAAWMKPFACADRQAYEAIWTSHYRGGIVQTCTLTDIHFDTETGELNGLGRAMIQGVMKNSPTNERNVYVFTGRSELDYDSKVRSVNSMISDYYGIGAAQVASTSVYPRSSIGLRNEQQNQLFIEGSCSNFVKHKC